MPEFKKMNLWAARAAECVRHFPRFASMVHQTAYGVRRTRWLPDQADLGR